jgi:hypothetical protein
MSSFSRFIDGVDVLPDDSWTPHTPSQLLFKLGVRNQPKDGQRKAVAEWLATNEPSTFLLMFLEDDGLVDGRSAEDASRHSAA